MLVKKGGAASNLYPAVPPVGSELTPAKDDEADVEERSNVAICGYCTAVHWVLRGAHEGLPVVREACRVERDRRSTGIVNASVLGVVHSSCPATGSTHRNR